MKSFDKMWLVNLQELTTLLAFTVFADDTTSDANSKLTALHSNHIKFTNS